MQRIFKLEINFSTPEKSPEAQAEQANQIEGALTGIDFESAIKNALKGYPLLKNVTIKVDTF